MDMKIPKKNKANKVKKKNIREVNDEGITKT